MVKNCDGCKWLDTTRPPNSLGYCMNKNSGIDPMYRARYEGTPRCKQYVNKNGRVQEVVNNG